MKLHYFTFVIVCALAVDLFALVSLFLPIDPKPGDTYVSMHTTRNIEYVTKVKEKKQEICSKKTGGTPTKGKKNHISADGPMKENAIQSLHLENDLGESIRFNVVQFEDSKFHKGKWAFVDPNSLRTNIGVDSDNEIWDRARDLYFEKYQSRLKTFDQKAFIASLMHFTDELIDSNKENIASFIFFKARKAERASGMASTNAPFVEDACDCVAKTPPAGDGKPKPAKLWCRHYSTFVLPLVARILRDKRSPFLASIHLDEVSTINDRFKTLSGHVWNVIKFDDGKRKPTPWVVDFFNHSFVDISPKTYKTMIAHNLSSSNGDYQLRREDLTTLSFIYPYVVATKRKLFPDKKSIYKNKATQEAVSCKRALFSTNSDNVLGSQDEIVIPLQSAHKRAYEKAFDDKENAPSQSSKRVRREETRLEDCPRDEDKA